MPINKEAYQQLITELQPKNVALVAVSKFKSLEDINELYDLGHRDFGENYVQEMAEKYSLLPPDIRWHYIGHLQRNKVKVIIPFVQLIQGVDSLRLLKEINNQAEKVNRVVDCLLQVHIAEEETKFGLDKQELNDLMTKNSGQVHELKNIKIVGLMGIASLTGDMGKVRAEFRYLKTVYNKYALLAIHHSPFTILSMGMSVDYKIAVEEGSNMVRIGSLIFGERG